MTLCSCVACTDRTQEPEKGQGGGNVQPAHFWDCECDIEQETYDLDNVALRFTFGYRSEYAKKHFYIYYYHDNYYDVDSHRTKPEYADFFDMNGHVKPEYESIMFPNVPIYLFFKSFGNLYLIKTVDDFFTDEYLGGNHTEEISIPSELFYNEYGMIQFSFTNDQDGGMGYFGGATIKSVCNIYYHKTGETVQLSKVDLASPYVGYIDEMKAKGLFSSDGVGYDLSRFYYNEESDYSTIYFNNDLQYGDSAYVYFCFGSIFNDREFDYVELYFIDGEEPERRQFVKRIDNYTADNYLLTVDRHYDYLSAVPSILGVRFAHCEKIQIPYSFLTERNEKLFLAVYGKESDETDAKLLTGSWLSCNHSYIDYSAPSVNERPLNQIYTGPLYDLEFREDQ